ncbi:MAG: hypothetical protein ABWX92_05980 [Mycetocola sp.]
MLRESGLSQVRADDAIYSDAFGPLTAELRRAEAYRFHISSLVARVVAARGFDDAQDIAAVLYARIASEFARVAGASRARTTPRLVVGLIPSATGPMDTHMRRALIERADLIEAARASAVLDQALLTNAPWTRALGIAPGGSASVAWRQHGCTIAAYRDRYGIVGLSTLGQAPQSRVQGMDAIRARAALQGFPLSASRSKIPFSDL